MSLMIRILGVFLVVEIVLCITLLYKHSLRHEPLLPDVTFDDPLLEEELIELAHATKSGQSGDLNAYADALLGRGFYSEAEHAYRTTLKLFPENQIAQFGLAFCLDRTGRTKASTVEYLKVAKMAKHQGELVGSRQHALYQTGKNYLREENKEAALDLFEENKDFEPASYQLAKLLLKQGQTEEALPIIKSILEKAPNSLKFNSLLLHALEEADAERLNAARMLERSRYIVPVDLNTNYVQPLSERTGINKKIASYSRLIGKGNMDLLASSLRNIWKLIENTNLLQKQNILMSMMEVEYQRRNPEAILQAVADSRALGISSAEMLQMEGAAYALQGNTDRAVELWEHAIKMSPNIPLHQMLSNYYQTQNNQPARKHHSAQAGLLTTKMHYWNNDLETAKKAAMLTMQLDSELPQIWFYLGEIESGLGNDKDALKAYQKCLELNPNHGRALRATELATPN